MISTKLSCAVCDHELNEDWKGICDSCGRVYCASHIVALRSDLHSCAACNEELNG